MTSAIARFDWYRALAADRRYGDIREAIAAEPALNPEDLSQLLAELAFFGGDILSSFLARGARLDSKDSEGKSALANCLLGAQDGYDTFQLFIDFLRSGADPDVEAAFGCTALQLALEEKKPEYAVALLLFGADPDQKLDSPGQLSPVEIAERHNLEWAIGLFRRWRRGNAARLPGSS